MGRRGRGAGGVEGGGASAVELEALPDILYVPDLASFAPHLGEGCSPPAARGQVPGDHAARKRACLDARCRAWLASG